MTPPRVLAAAGVSAGGNPGKDVGASLRGASGTPPPTACPGRAAAGACPSSGPAGPPSPEGEGKGCCWRQRKPPRDVGDAAPTVCPGMGGSGSLPLIRPCGATFPQGGRQGLQGRDSSLPGCWRRRKVAAGWGHPALRMGIWKRPRGLRGHPFPGRRTVGAGHARPGGLRRPPSTVRSVGRGLDPSAGGYPGDGRRRKPPRGVGDAAPYGLPGNGRLPRLTLPTSPPAYSRCCRRQNRWGRSAHRPDARFRRWIRSRGASGHRRSGPEGTGVCCRCNFSSAG